MELGSKAGFFQQIKLGSATWIVLNLLTGCSHASRNAVPPGPSALPQTANIGIPACNAYLNSYLACHRAAHIFPADTLESHYQAMLLSLQQGAADPKVRPYLPGRCVDLRHQLITTLQGRSCTASATNVGAPSQSAPGSVTPMPTQH